MLLRNGSIRRNEVKTIASISRSIRSMCCVSSVAAVASDGQLQCYIVDVCVGLCVFMFQIQDV